MVVITSQLINQLTIFMFLHNPHQGGSIMKTNQQVFQTNQPTNQRTNRRHCILHYHCILQFQQRSSGWFPVAALARHNYLTCCNCVSNYHYQFPGTSFAVPQCDIVDMGARYDSNSVGKFVRVHQGQGICPLAPYCKSLPVP